jgi:hypothetical protein
VRIKQAVKALVPFWLGVLADGVNKGTASATRSKGRRRSQQFGAN